MIILVYGDNDYLSRKKVELMKQQYIQKFDPSGLNILRFDEKVGLGEAIQAIQSSPFLAQKRMVIIKGLVERLKKADVDAWAESLVKTPESTIVILWDELSDKKVEKHELYKRLKNFPDAHFYAHSELTGRDLSIWANQKAKELKLKIDSQLLEELIALVGSDLWQLDSELQKLAAYSRGESVTRQMITDLVRANFEDQIFGFVDAVSNKQSKQAMKLLHDQRLSGSSDHHLLFMLARQVRLLIGARSILDQNPRATKQDVASALKVHPFVAQKALSQARNLNTQTLEHLHNQLFEFDQKIKRSGMKIDLAVDRLVAEMLIS